MKFTAKEIELNRRAWIRALESGKYKQGRGALHRRGRHCCLGVACEVLLNRGVPMETVERNNTTFYDSCYLDLPPIAVEALGLNTALGDFEGPVNKSCALTSLNDSGRRFKTIAKVIRSNPKGLFKKLRTNKK